MKHILYVVAAVDFYVYHVSISTYSREMDNLSFMSIKEIAVASISYKLEKKEI